MEDFESTRTEFINSALSYINKHGNLCKLYLDENEITNAHNELQKSVKAYCIQDVQFSEFKKSLDKLEQENKDAENVPHISYEDTWKKLNSAVPEITEDTISQHPFMVQFLREIEDKELETEVETVDGIVAPEIFTPPVDPITKTAIKNPVRNTQCGHVYEKDSITELIKKKKTRCPYIGCPAFQYIHTSFLQPDRKLKKQIDLHFLNNCWDN